MLRQLLFIYLLVLPILWTSVLYAEESVLQDNTALGLESDSTLTNTIDSILEEIVSPARKVERLVLVEANRQALGVQTLEDFIQQHMRSEEELAELESDLRLSVSEPEKDRLREKISTIEEELKANEENFEGLATGVKVSQDNEDEPENLNFSQNLQLLLDPLFKALMQSTEGIRVKAEKIEEINKHEATLAQADQALKNLGIWLERDISEGSRVRLTELLEEWQNQRDVISTNLSAAQLQLADLEAKKTSISDRFGNNVKNFFQTRGLYCILGILSFFMVLLISRLIYKLWSMAPFMQDGKRSFNLRLFALVYKAVSVVLASIAPLMVFYFFEDWVMFSIGLLIAFGVLWSLRNVIPSMWRQGRLLLNIGSVREGERIMYFGLPWRVKSLAIFSELENPENKLRLRIPIEDFLGLTSKPVQTSESWFPCKRGDFVILSDGFRGKVTAISVEFIDLGDRGGSTKTYPMQEFLDLRPLNISESFRLKESLGISYDHQVESTNRVLGRLKKFIAAKIADEGYEPHAKNLSVEFLKMSDSSLDVTVILDVDGSQAPYYNRLRRAMQRWCVDACTENGWEIPFPQRTVHVHNAQENVVLSPQADLFVKDEDKTEFIDPEQA